MPLCGIHTASQPFPCADIFSCSFVAAMAALSFLTLPLLFKFAVAGIVFELLRMVYRLTFHPLARFPGPKLAGATNLYAASYDLVSGAYLFKLAELHAQYGSLSRALS